MTYIATARGYGNDRLIIEVIGGKRPGRTIVPNNTQSVRRALSTYDREELKFVPLNGVNRAIRGLATSNDLGRLVDSEF